MTQQGFRDYVFAVFNKKSGTARSYVKAIQIIDEVLAVDDVYSLKGKSLACIDNTKLLMQVSKFVCDQQTLYIKGEKSIFDNIDSGQKSYPGKRFCSAAIKQLLEYHKYDLKVKEADEIVARQKKGVTISKELGSHFDIDKEGTDIQVTTTARLGQAYFRKMVLANYGNQCCITGLNVPQTLRASHIVAWAEDKKHRMDPENGLCLSATYDAAFDKHLISFDDDYRMIVSKEIKDYYTNDATKEYFDKYEGTKLMLPQKFMPSKKLLAKHRELMG